MSSVGWWSCATGRGLMFLSSCIHEKGEVQTRAAAVSPMPPLVFTHSLFLAYAQTAVDDAAFGAGAYLSCTPHSLQMKAECIYSPACHPAASGRGITLATMNKRGLIQKQALACLVTHCHTSRVHHTITAEVFCCVCVFVCFCLSDFDTLQGVYETQESLTQ